MFLFFSLPNGLYLAQISAISLDSSDFSTFDDFNSTQTVLVAQMRSKTLSLPDLVVLPDVPVPINLPTSVEYGQSLPAASDIISPVFTLPEPSTCFKFYFLFFEVDWCWLAFAACTSSSWAFA